MTQQELIKRLKHKVEERKRTETPPPTPAPRTPLLFWFLERQQARFKLLSEHFVMLRIQGEEATQLAKIKTKLAELAEEDLR